MHPGEAGAPDRNRAASWIDERGRKKRQFERSLERVHLPLQGVSHAARPEDKRESSSKETICWPLAAATIECAAPRATGFSQREKKL
jgi:hypothetical protein